MPYFAYLFNTSQRHEKKNSRVLLFLEGPYRLIPSLTLFSTSPQRGLGLTPHPVFTVRMDLASWSVRVET